MDKQEYLNEISTSAKATAIKHTPTIFSSKFFWVGTIGAILFIIIIIIGSIISGSKTNVKEHLFSLILHMDNTKEVVEEYRPDIKSSDLRSYGASLVTILSNDSSSLTAYATEKYDFKTKNVKESITEEETSRKDDLSSDLFNAKITGSLDHIYAQKLTTDISLIQSLESQIIKASSDPTLQDILNASYESLTVLYDKFKTFSESK